MRRVGWALAGTGLVTAVLIAVKSQAPAPLPVSAAVAEKDSVTRSYLGAVVPNRYGPVQVRISVRAGRLVDVEAVQLPTAAARGVEIGRRAVPMLREQALQRQSADLDTVSGATYTSDGYRRSLQSAIDAARAA
ncbi:MAG TPA: FMN-binding protein [Dactylosporangium sp.]|nr:FMN-binding protein [Dactylosporangium sp.]